MASRHSGRLTAVCAALFFCILLTRLAALMHNYDLHPDELVFMQSAERLADFLTGKAVSYAPTKFYPEGSFVLLAPFELLRRALHSAAEWNPRLFGRLGGLVYFLLGTGLGLKILRQYFTKDTGTSVLYLLTMLFGIVHIELSRYATGDTASFFFLMLLILWTAKGMDTGGLRFFLLASGVGGILAAIKYPLAYFLLIPYLGFRKTFSADSKKVLRKNTLKAAGCFLIGFLLLSPKTLTDPSFIFWTAAHETHNYMAGTNYVEVGGPVNHLISLAAYLLLYSGFPLLTGLAVFHWGRRVPAARQKKDTAYLFQFVIPLTAAGFFLYNLFVTALFMRTYYPFYVLLDLYCAVFCGSWLRQKGWKQISVIVLSLGMVLRGGYYVYVLSTDDALDNMHAILSAISPDSYETVEALDPGKLAWDVDDMPQFDGAENLNDDRFAALDTARLQPGELIIATTQEHGIGSPYPLPIFHQAVNTLIQRWALFKEANADLEIARLYPESYYRLFGFWIKGTTGMIFEFPSNIFYLNPLA